MRAGRREGGGAAHQDEPTIGGQPVPDHARHRVRVDREVAVALVLHGRDVAAPRSGQQAEPRAEVLRVEAHHARPVAARALDVQIDAPSGGVSVLYLPPRDYADPPRVGVSASGACVRWHPETGELLVRSAASNDPLRVHVEPAP